MTAVRFTVSFTGQVQGVGFRATTSRIARRFEVSGWVRNEPDGSVTCIVEGPRPEAQAFLLAVQDEMSGCIREANTEEGRPEGLKGFEVR